MFGTAVDPDRSDRAKSFRFNIFHLRASGIFLAFLPVTRVLRDGNGALMEPTHAPQAAAPLPGSKSKGKGKVLIIAVLAVLVLGGGGAAGYWMWAASRAAADATETTDGETASQAKPKAKNNASDNLGLVEFPGFLVNLADAGGQAYLRAALGLLVSDEGQAKLLAEKPVLKSLLRSAILEVLAQQTGTVLVTPEGKAELKRAIIEKINSLDQNVEVEDVLFSDFVVQY
jgi:flagellar protein FliL